MSSPVIPLILQEVRFCRQSENFMNVLRFVGVFCLALVVAGCAMLVTAPDRVGETISFIALAAAFLFFWTISSAIMFVLLFWPFLLYFWGTVNVVRQRTLLSLIQTAVETNTPLQNIIRVYASGCWSRYAARLERFAAALDSGRTLEDAVRENPGLFRYDIAGIIRLGGGDPESLRSLETVGNDERDFAAIRTNSLIRIAYLCVLGASMLLVMNFVLIFIVPQFEKIFKDFDTELPVLTLYVTLLSRCFVRYWYLGAPLIPLVALAFIAYLILQTNVFVVRPWGFRRMFRSTDSAKFLMVLAVGMRRRVPIPAIMEMYRRTVPCDYLRNKGVRIQKVVEGGGDWIDAARRANFVNAPEAALLRSAERTGNTATVLDQLAQSKERSQIRKDDLFSKLMFIPLVWLLAAFIGVFVIAMFLPLLKLVTSLSGVPI